jgi:hypothetical protein
LGQRAGADTGPGAVDRPQEHTARRQDVRRLFVREHALQRDLAPHGDIAGRDVRCRGQHSDRAGGRECRQALGKRAHTPSVERREEPQREQEDVDHKRCREQPAL